MSDQTADRDKSAVSAIRRTRPRRAVLTAVLLGATVGGLMSATVVVLGIDAAAAALPPYQNGDGESEEPADPIEGEDDAEQPADPSDGEESPDEGSEPEPEPGDVPAFVWVGAGVLVIVAIIWGVSVAGGD